jgi:hypothetical protein
MVCSPRSAVALAALPPAEARPNRRSAQAVRTPIGVPERASSSGAASAPKRRLSVTRRRGRMAHWRAWRLAHNRPATYRRRLPVQVDRPDVWTSLADPARRRPDRALGGSGCWSARRQEVREPASSRIGKTSSSSRSPGSKRRGPFALRDPKIGGSVPTFEDSDAGDAAKSLGEGLEAGGLVPLHATDALRAGWACRAAANKCVSGGGDEEQHHPCCAETEEREEQRVHEASHLLVS